jgi:hypothetical protein
MGLACPVCEVPHPDPEHLADHVAITATTREGEHRAWLDKHAPDWRKTTRADLAAFVAERAEEVDSVDLHEEVASHESRAPGTNPGPSVADVSGELDEEARAMVAEARELTERMLNDVRDGKDGVGEGVEGNGGDGEDGGAEGDEEAERNGE